jgi:hypothetical protein
MSKYLTPGRCQNRRLHAAIEQHCAADRSLEILDAPGHRRLRKTKAQRSSIDRARFSKRDVGF